MSRMISAQRVDLSDGFELFFIYLECMFVIIFPINRQTESEGAGVILIGVRKILIVLNK